MAANGGILVVNSGSSSVKFALFDAAPGRLRRLTGETLYLDEGFHIEGMVFH